MGRIAPGNEKGLILVMDHQTYTYIKTGIDHLAVNDELYARMKSWLDSALRNYSSDGKWSVWNWPTFPWGNVNHHNYDVWETLFNHLIAPGHCQKLKFKWMCKEGKDYIELGNTSDGPYTTTTVCNCSYSQNTYAAINLDVWSVHCTQAISSYQSWGLIESIIRHFEKRRRKACLQE